MYILEKEGQEILNCGKCATSHGDSYADASKDTVFPERRRYNGYAVILLLMSDIKSENGKKEDGDYEECQGCRFEEA